MRITSKGPVGTPLRRQIPPILEKLELGECCGSSWWVPSQMPTNLILQPLGAKTLGKREIIMTLSAEWYSGALWETNRAGLYIILLCRRWVYGWCSHGIQTHQWFVTCLEDWHHKTLLGQGELGCHGCIMWPVLASITILFVTSVAGRNWVRHTWVIYHTWIPPHFSSQSFTLTNTCVWVKCLEH